MNSAKQSEQPKQKKTFTLRSLRIDRSTISPPKLSSFLHVSHVGFDAKGAVQASKELDPAWGAVLQGSRGSGPVQEVTINDINVVEGIVVETTVERIQAEAAVAEFGMPPIYGYNASRLTVGSKATLPAIASPEAAAEFSKRE
ncbi:hypothetical protein HWV62_44854 [Athelia sp. TMB]|nr:hypothetical protein HWV62_42617 [Athelia sp. TMB]KAF7978793.1 hypothetical protein HWV62_44854 [Athelia sp. TMB]